MTTLKYTVNFKRTLLATLIGLSVSQYCFALEELSDDTLSDSTGEGIALLPENFSMRFNGVDDANGAGSIRLIPVGPSSKTIEAKGYQKAEVFLNGISLAQSKKDYGAARTADDWGTPFGNIGTAPNDFGRQINSWGTTNNPWILRTVTQDAVPDFSGASKSVAYLDLEAPLVNATMPTNASELSAYNLKMGIWVDAFTRDKNLAEDVTNRMNGLANRIRLAAVWDGFSINGSNFKIFRTLGGVPAASGSTWGTYTANLKINNVMTPKTFNYGPRPSYNETLGVVGVVRMNSGVLPKAENAAVDTSIYVQGGITRNIYALKYTGRDAAGAPVYTETTDVTGNPIGQEEIYTTYLPLVGRGSPKDVPGTFNAGGACYAAAKGGSGGNTSGTGQAGQCTTREGVTARRFKLTSKNDWVAPVVKSVLKIGTQELTGAATDDKTPAFGGLVPNFKSNTSSEGIFLYNPNINLVLGSLQQPLIFNTEKSSSGNSSNFSIELTRIPNNINIYKNIYQRYEEIDPSGSVDKGIAYLGSTCTISKCGSVVPLGGVNYQDSKATHSSITIGTSQLDANGRLVAYKGIDAYGISFGALQTATGLNSVVSKDYTQVWTSTRTATNTTKECMYRIIFCTDYSYVWGGWGGWQPVAKKNVITNPTHPSLKNDDPYETTFRQNQNGQIYGIQTTLPSNVNDATTLLNNMKPIGSTPMNNMGSAVVDGLLIQHFKFTTTGL